MQKNKIEVVKNSENIKIDSDIAISVKGFSKKYSRNKHYSVKDLNFIVSKGEFHGFVGANGAGKTTVIKSIIGAYARFEGNISIFNHKNTKISAKKLIGYIPEAAQFPDSFTTRSYLKAMSMLAGVSAKDSVNFANAKLKQLGLLEIANRNPNKLSSGQKKKVLLAQALINNPEVIIMDEPAANLDPKARTEFFETLVKLKEEQKVTIFISSHILDELEKYIDSVTIIDGGKMVFSGNIQDAYQTNGNDISWEIKFEDDEAATLELKKLKLKFKNSINSKIIKLTKPELIKLMQTLFAKNIEITFIRKEGNDPTSIYNRFVKEGSLDIGGKNV